MVAKNKKLIITLIALVLVTYACFASNAFFTSAETTINNFKVATYSIETKEDFKPKDNWRTETIKKEVWAENTGTTPAYIRIKIVPFWRDGLPIKVNDDDTVKLNISDSTLWEKIGDYYYYKKILNPSEKTECLLKDVKINSDLEKINNNYNIKNLSIDVFTESIIHLNDSNNENKKINDDRLESTWGVSESDIF